jgi:hypothetical protein
VTGAKPVSNLARTRPAPRPRDPLGKAALFSQGESEPVAAPVITEPEGRGSAHLFSQAEGRAGTLVVDCAACSQATRVTYAEFAALHLPVWLWIPSPTRSHRHWLRCPACHHFAWLRARWLE